MQAKQEKEKGAKGQHATKRHQQTRQRQGWKATSKNKQEIKTRQMQKQEKGLVLQNRQPGKKWVVVGQSKGTMERIRDSGGSGFGESGDWKTRIMLHDCVDTETSHSLLNNELDYFRTFIWLKLLLQSGAGFNDSGYNL